MSLRTRSCGQPAILAGGRARRLGGLDKRRFRSANGPSSIASWEMLRARTPHILIVGHDDPRYREAGVSVVVDGIAGAGSLGGLYTALMAAPTQQITVMACDMPFLPFLAHLATFDPDGRLLVNINTPDDYARTLEAVEPPPRID